jgi:hypothetical protein
MSEATSYEQDTSTDQRSILPVVVRANFRRRLLGRMFTARRRRRLRHALIGGVRTGSTQLIKPGPMAIPHVQGPFS